MLFLEGLNETCYADVAVRHLFGSMNNKMKEIFKAGIISLLLGISYSYSQSETNESEWIRYDLENLALFADVPSRLEPMCGESLCFFSSQESAEFESLRAERYYYNSDSKKDFLKFKTDTSTNYFVIELDSIRVYVHTKHPESNAENLSSWAYFSAGNYEYQLAYTGPFSEQFIRFIKSIEIDYDRLKEQFEQNQVEPDYSNLNLKFDLDLGENDFLINRTKYYCKIQMPKSDSIKLFLSCEGCALSIVQNDEWVITPLTNKDSIKIVLKTSLPENRTYTFYEQIIAVRREE